jgi:solute carrier family 12 sodium/potassium/chloride transporter 2
LAICAVGLLSRLLNGRQKKVSQLTASRERPWKANLLVPVEASQQLRDSFGIIRNISYPSGFLKIVGLTGREKEYVLAKELSGVAYEFHDKGVFTPWTVITAATFGENLQAGIETFAGAFFKPNVVFLTMPKDESRESELKAILDTCRERKIGVLLMHEHTEKRKNGPSAVNVWFADREPDWKLEMDIGNQDLALLMGYKLELNWKIDLHLVAKVGEAKQKEVAEAFLRLVAETARIPETDTVAVTDKHEDKAPQAGLHIFPLPDEVDFSKLRQYNDRYKATCLIFFVR